MQRSLTTLPNLLHLSKVILKNNPVNVTNIGNNKWHKLMSSPPHPLTTCEVMGKMFVPSGYHL